MRWYFRWLCDGISGGCAMIKLRWYYPSPFFQLVEYFNICTHLTFVFAQTNYNCFIKFFFWNFTPIELSPNFTKLLQNAKIFLFFILFFIIYYFLNVLFYFYFSITSGVLWIVHETEKILDTIQKVSKLTNDYLFTWLDCMFYSKYLYQNSLSN